MIMKGIDAFPGEIKRCKEKITGRRRRKNPGKGFCAKRKRAQREG